MVIYVIENQITGKMYVGQTSKSSKTRWIEHYREKRCSALNNAIKKYGADAFSVRDIDTADTQEELDNKERFWIEALGTMAPNGYNLRSGGRTGGVLSLDSRKKISETKKGKPLTFAQKEGIKNRNQRGENHPMFGRHHSEETKRKISAANKGRLAGEKNPRFGVPLREDVKIKLSESRKEYYKTHLNVHCKPVLCIETGVEYPSATHASRATGIDNSQISKVCRGILPSAGKLHWVYVCA